MMEENHRCSRAHLGRLQDELELVELRVAEACPAATKGSRGKAVERPMNAAGPRSFTTGNMPPRVAHVRW